VSPLHPAREMLEKSLHGVDFEIAFGIDLKDFETCLSSALPQIRTFRSHFAGDDGSYQTVPLSSPRKMKKANPIYLSFGRQRSSPR